MKRVAMSIICLALMCSAAKAIMFSFSHADITIPEGADYGPAPRPGVGYYGQSPILFFGIRFLDSEKDNSFHLGFSDDSWTGAIWLDGGRSYPYYTASILSYDAAPLINSPHWVTAIFDFSPNYGIGPPICYSIEMDPSSPDYQPPHWDLQSFEFLLPGDGGLSVDWMGFASNADDFPVPEPSPEPSAALLLSLGLIGLATRRLKR